MTGKTALIGLIALVATAVLVDGERVIVQAGEPLPEPMKKRDRDELLSSKAATESAQRADVSKAADPEPSPAPAPAPAPVADPAPPAKPTASEPQSRPKKK